MTIKRMTRNLKVRIAYFCCLQQCQSLKTRSHPNRARFFYYNFCRMLLRSKFKTLHNSHESSSTVLAMHLLQRPKYYKRNHTFLYEMSQIKSQILKTNVPNVTIHIIKYNFGINRLITSNSVFLRDV